MLRNAQNVCNNNIALLLFFFLATKSLLFYRNEVHLRCGLCQCRIHYSSLVHMAVFLVHFYLFFFFYFVHIHRRKAKKKSSELYNIVIIQKDLFLIFFFLYKKSQSVAAQLLVGREGRERERFVHLRRRWESFSSTAPSQIHIWAMADSTWSPLTFEIQISPDGRSTLDLGCGLAGSKQKDNPCSKWGREKKNPSLWIDVLSLRYSPKVLEEMHSGHVPHGAVNQIRCNGSFCQFVPICVRHTLSNID